MSRRIYVASSWKNNYQPNFVGSLREQGHLVYDFRNPDYRTPGFSWSQTDPEWESWDFKGYLKGLQSEPAQQGFSRDLEAMKWADTFICLLPSGRSAHLELGWATAQPNVKTAVFVPSSFEPELMYKLADLVTSNAGALAGWLNSLKPST